MDLMFWRKRDRRLEERLTFVVDVVERVRQSAPPQQPRVEIDTSFVEAPHDPAQPLAQQTHPHPVQPQVPAQYEADIQLPPNDDGYAADPEANGIESDPSYAATLQAIDELVALVEDLDAELARQRAALSEAEGERDQALHDLQTLRDQPGAQAGEGGDARKSREQVEHLMAALSIAQGEREEIEAERDKALSELETLRQSAGEHASGAGGNEEARKQIKELQAALDRAEKAREATEAERNEAQRELKTLQKDAKAGSGAIQKAEKAREQIEHLEAALSLAHEERNEIEAQRNRASSELESLRGEFESLRSDLEAHATQLLEGEKAQQRVGQLETDLAAAKRQLEEADAEHGAASKELDALRKSSKEHETQIREGEKLQEQVAKLEAALSLAREERKDVEVARDEAARRADAAQKELDSLTNAADQRDADATAKIEDAEQEVARLKAELGSVRVARAKADTRADEAEKARDKASKELEALRKDKDQGSAAGKDELSALRDQLTRAEGDLSRAKDEKTKADNACKEASDRAEEAEKALQAEKKTVKRQEKVFKNELDAAQSKITRLENQLERAGKSAQTQKSNGKGPSATPTATAPSKPDARATVAEADKPQQTDAQAGKSQSSSEPAKASDEKTSAQKTNEKETSGTSSPSPATAPAKDHPKAAAKDVKSTTDKAKKDDSEDEAAWSGKDRRREPRSKSRIRAKIWRKGMSKAWNCIIRERSSGGAQIEYVQDRYGDTKLQFESGDNITLKYETPLERITVTCVIIWAGHNCCGVKFAGQFLSEAKSTPKSPKKKKADDANASTGTKAAKLLAKTVSFGRGGR